MSRLTNIELGVVIAESFWVSGDAMRETEKTVASLREEAARRGEGTVSTERFQVANFLRARRIPPGGGVRLVRADTDPKRIDEAITAYEDVTLPWLTEAEGFCAALLFVDRRSGRSISETVWYDHGALAASRSAAAAIRRDTVAATDSAIRAIEEYRLIFHSAEPT
jgi:hypothetical protein